MRRLIDVVRFLRIRDAELAEDYSLPALPALVFFRHEIPVVYQVVPRWRPPAYQ
jgi:hypothetical protein